MSVSPQRRFLLAGLALAASGMAALLWLGALFDRSYLTPNVHETCGQPVSLRAEGYNLLGGTRYGTGPDDPGDDVDLAHVDVCDLVVERLPNNEERLWFWLEVEAVGRVFPYYAWGVPEEDIENDNANDWRDPVDPLWNFSSLIVGSYPPVSLTYWPTGRGEVCPSELRDLPGINLFFDSPHSFRIPQGRTREAWVCVRMGEGQMLPETLFFTLQPGFARITRWVDKIVPILAIPEENTSLPRQQRYLLPVVNGNAELCDFARQAHPESVPPGGGC